jgi:hypothetical protein
MVLLDACVNIRGPAAPVAQLDRAPGYEPGGREFESLRAHQFFQPLAITVPRDFGTPGGTRCANIR